MPRRISDTARPRRRLSIVAIVLSLVVGLSLTSCSIETDSPPADRSEHGFASASSQVKLTAKNVKTPTDAEVPADAKLGGSPVELSTKDTIPAAGFTLTRKLKKPVQADEAAALAYLDEETKTWIPVPTTISEDRRTLSAVTTHLSIWDDLHATIGTLQGARFPAPTCDGRPPAWVKNVDFFDDQNSELRWCAGSDPKDPTRLVIKAAANRGYGFAVRPVAKPAWTWATPALKLGPANLATLGLHNTALLPGTWLPAMKGTAFVWPGAELHLGFNEAEVRAVGGKALITVERRISWALAGILAPEVISEFGNTVAGLWVIGSLIDCAVSLTGVSEATEALVAAYNCAVDNRESVTRAATGIAARFGEDVVPMEELRTVAKRAWVVTAALYVLKGSLVVLDFLKDMSGPEITVRVESAPKKSKPPTDIWELEVQCRGGTPGPENDRLCAQRDAAMRKTAFAAAAEFVKAWKTHDDGRIVELATSDSILSWTAQTPVGEPECEYDIHSETQVMYCYVSIDGADYDLGFGMDAEFVHPYPPVWKVTGIAPDSF